MARGMAGDMGSNDRKNGEERLAARGGTTDDEGRNNRCRRGEHAAIRAIYVEELNLREIVVGSLDDLVCQALMDLGCMLVDKGMSGRGLPSESSPCGETFPEAGSVDRVILDNSHRG